MRGGRSGGQTDPEQSQAVTPAVQGREGSARWAWIVLASGLALLGLWTLRGFLPALGWGVILAVATWPLYGRVRRAWPPGRHGILLPTAFTAAIALLFLLPLGLLALQATREAGGLFLWLEEVRRTGLPADWLKSAGRSRPDRRTGSPDRGSRERQSRSRTFGGDCAPALPSYRGRISAAASGPRPRPCGPGDRAPGRAAPPPPWSHRPAGRPRCARDRCPDARSCAGHRCRRRRGPA